MRVALTGASGFMGRNLTASWTSDDRHEVRPVPHDQPDEEVVRALDQADVVVHLAGVNRPPDVEEFETGNAGFTARLCDLARRLSRTPPPILFASSVHAASDTPYGLSKRSAEAVLWQHAETARSTVRIVRLPNVFGRWGRPDYNSAIATFCHRLNRGIPIEVHEPDRVLRLVHVDDVADCFEREMTARMTGSGWFEVGPVYGIRLGTVAAVLQGFAQGAAPDDLTEEPVDPELLEKLRRTYDAYRVT